MSKINNYVVVVNNTTTKSLPELVREHLGTAAYAHNSQRSKVVTAKAEFIRMIQTEFRSVKEDPRFNTFPKLVVAMSLGKYVIDSKVWNRFVSRLAIAVGYQDLPQSGDAMECFGIMAQDYVEGNPFIKAELIAEIGELPNSFDATEDESALESELESAPEIARVVAVAS